MLDHANEYKMFYSNYNEGVYSKVLSRSALTGFRLAGGVI